MQEQLLHRHTFHFGSASLITEFYDNGDKITADCNGIFLNQRIRLDGDNAAQIELCADTISPKQLRILADQMEKAQEKALIEKYKRCGVEEVI